MQAAEALAKGEDAEETEDVSTKEHATSRDGAHESGS